MGVVRRRHDHQIDAGVGEETLDGGVGPHAMLRLSARPALRVARDDCAQLQSLRQANQVSVKAATRETVTDDANFNHGTPPGGRYGRYRESRSAGRARRPSHPLLSPDAGCMPVR